MCIICFIKTSPLAQVHSASHALRIIAILSTHAVIFSKIVTAAVADIGALQGVAYAAVLAGLAACLAGTGDQQDLFPVLPVEGH